MGFSYDSGGNKKKTNIVVPSVGKSTGTVCEHVRVPRSTYLFGYCLYIPVLAFKTISI